MTAGRPLPALSRGIEVAEFDTELVALVPDRRRAVLLEGGPAIVLDSCRRGDTVEQVRDELALASGDEPTRVEVWLDGVLRELARVGVVAAVGVTDSMPSAGVDEIDGAP